MKPEIFLKSKQNLHIPPNLRLLFLCSPILNISIVSFSSSLNRLNALSAFRQLEPIGNAQKLTSGLI